MSDAVPAPPSRRALQLLASRAITPDRFQQDAFDAVDRGNSVLVAAPTSSGKTLVAEYAAARALEAGLTVAYTAPTKALSNQKLRDLAGWLGDDVGLLTGDNVVRPDARTVVMTTEVLRNMIYAGSGFLDDLGVVVLDEVHYLQDPYRGSVWEEVIIGLPARTRLVCLSATVSNAAELAEWIGSVREHCESVVETERPVELHDHFLVFDRTGRRMHEFPTLSGGRPNRDVERFLEPARRGGDQRGAGRGAGRGDRGESGRNGSRRDRDHGVVRPARPRHVEVIDHLVERGRLPAIVFVFSRRGCDDAVRTCLEHGVALADPTAQRRVREIAAQHLAGTDAADRRALRYDEWVDGLVAGVAAHHAGMVPPFKEAVEDCFAAGLLGVVFATETLALGVNMPARSVVVEQLSRFRGDGFALLTPGEYTQLTGRAGRRGIDDVGHAYTLWNPYTSFHEAAHLVASGDFELESSFRPTFNMAVNLIATCRDRAQAVGLLERSFAQFRANGRVPEWADELDDAKAELARARRRLRQLGGSKQENRTAAAARRRVETCERRANALTGRIGLAEGGLARSFDAITALLEELGCVRGWSLTDSGEQLRSVFHDTDLLVVLALRSGLLDGRRPAEMAGLVSCLSYEHRSRTDPPPPRFPSTAVAEAAREIESLGVDLNVREERVGLVQTRLPEAAFFECAYAWATGAALEDILGTGERPAPRRHGRRPARSYGRGAPSEGSGDGAARGGLGLGSELTPGDFVRQIRNLADLLSQVAKVAQRRETRRSATAAMRAVDRGVVAVATRIAGAGPAGAGAADESAAVRPSRSTLTLTPATTSRGTPAHEGDS